MLFFCIITRFWDRFFSIEPSDQELFGFAAESILQKILTQKNYTAFYNRILKSPYNKHRFLEIDAIIYHNNTIFCVEMKNYKGTIYYAANFQNDTFDSYKTNTIIQLKTDKHLNQTFKALPNPLDKTKFFTKQLRKYLLRFDNRFSTIKFKSVVVFLDSSTNIDGIQSFEEGLIYFSQLEDFLEQQSQNGTNNAWVLDYLEKLPTFDKIITVNNQTIQGILKEIIIHCQKPNTELDLKKIRAIDIKHKFTSCKAQIMLQYNDLTTCEFVCDKLTVILDKFGTLQKHRLSNINKIIVGTHSLRPL
ncbi:hypothetical protein DESAMIL20_1700 [Desulfurella amilsii]|uniref:NERD domain-containing protein n=1 Tax=Desulfurella amilsii TaxID=1562698 RepID=A0A1X4XX82_9BACT|nr:nuclease-related domain-containing protein [Desulfurella amilsii]OSS42147.1 hypothetical protein DESAMIL20_1700 [Desulfurella amilsii]